MKIVGIDVHKKMCQAAVLDEDGKLLDELRFPNDPEGIEEFAAKLTSFRDEVLAVVESTGNLWIPIHDRLEKRGVDVALSNPSKTRIISEAKVKTDRRDTNILASLLRADMLCTCYVPGEELRSRRELLRQRPPRPEPQLHGRRDTPQRLGAPRGAGLAGECDGG